MTSDIAVLFDIDGTLVDSTYHHALAWQRACTSEGLAIPFWRIHRSIGMGGDRLVTEVAGEDVERSHGDRLRAAWREQYAAIRHEVRPLPGAADLIHALRAEGIGVALASSGDPDFAEEAVALLGVGDAIALLTTSADVDASKPAPDLLETTLARLGDPGAAVMVGDTRFDVESAIRAGMDCVAVLAGGHSRDELRQARLIVDDPADLAAQERSGWLSQR